MATAAPVGERSRRTRRRKQVGRWRREVKAIALLVVAGFALIALATVDPSLNPTEQRGPAGPVGIWLGWLLFGALGYAAFLVPLVLALLGIRVFVRPVSGAGWVPFAGLGVLLLSATGLLTEAVPLWIPEEAAAGGLVGWGLAQILDAAVGRVGTWLILLAGMPIGVLCVTQISYAALSRALSARLAVWQRRGKAKVGDGRVVTTEESAATALSFPGLPVPSEGPQPPVVVEPRARGAGGLAWQETFDLGRDGAAAFQLPSLGLLRSPDTAEHQQSREELQENAETLRRKLLDFEVEGRIVQVSPGPVITSYEFEPAAGVKISRVVNLADDLALALKAAAVRIVGPIPGRGTVAIEVPNAEPALVYLREIFASPDFTQSKRRLPLALGKDVTGGPVVSDLTAMPHLLIAGATGTGKSVGLNAMICSILYTMTPADVR
ncbi:MAG: DNA translocase FtsK 4TM domain-containing protein, partial [Candidatus Rokuibacteriota bacterium]